LQPINVDSICGNAREVELDCLVHLATGSAPSGELIDLIAEAADPIQFSHAAGWRGARGYFSLLGVSLSAIRRNSRDTCGQLRPPVQVVPMSDMTLEERLASLRVPLDAKTEREVQALLWAFVDDRKAEGWPAERVIVAVKQIAREAGLKHSTVVIKADAKPTA